MLKTCLKHNYQSLFWLEDDIFLTQIKRKLHNLVALWGQRSNKTVPANPSHTHIFERKSRKDLNPEVLKSSGFIGKGLICVELRPFYCRER